MLAETSTDNPGGIRKRLVSGLPTARFGGSAAAAAVASPAP